MSQPDATGASTKINHSAVLHLWHHPFLCHFRTTHCCICAFTINLIDAQHPKLSRPADIPSTPWTYVTTLQLPAALFDPSASDSNQSCCLRCPPLILIGSSSSIRLWSSVCGGTPTNRNLIYLAEGVRRYLKRGARSRPKCWYHHHHNLKKWGTRLRSQYSLLKTKHLFLPYFASKIKNIKMYSVFHLKRPEEN